MFEQNDMKLPQSLCSNLMFCVYVTKIKYPHMNIEIYIRMVRSNIHHGNVN